MSKSATCCFVLLLALASFSAANEGDFGEISEQEWQMGAPPAYPDVNAIVIFDKGRLEVTTEGISFHRHVRIKVLNEAGVDEVGDVSIWYWDEDKIKNFKAHTITPGGKKHEVDRKDVHTQSVGSQRSRTFSFPKVQPGCILEYRYRNFHKRFAHLDPWYFQNNQFTLLSEMSLVLAPGFTYSSVTNNVPGSSQNAVASEDPHSDNRIFTWTMRDVTPFRDEPLSCARHYFTPSLHCQMVKYQDAYQTVPFVKGWSDLGEFFTDRVIGEWASDHDGLEALVERLTADQPDAEAKLRAVYQYVCDSITLTGDGNSKYPSNDHLDNLLESREATAGEKNLLIIEVAREAGLTAYPVLICTRDYGIFNPQIYQLQQFNHLIAMVEVAPNQLMLVDASSKYCPFGVLPPQSAVNAGFLLDGAKSRVVSTAVPEPKSYRIDNTVVQPNGDGTVRCSTTVMLSGYFTEQFGRFYDRMDEQEFFDELVLSELDIDKTVEDYNFVRSDDRRTCTATVTYTAAGLASVMDDATILIQPALAFRTNPFVDDKRLFPIDFKFPATYHSAIIYLLDSTQVATDLPERHQVSVDGASFVHQCSADDWGVRVESRLSIEKSMVAPTSYGEIKGLFQEVERAYEDPIVVVPKTIAGEAP